MRALEKILSLANLRRSVGGTVDHVPLLQQQLNGIWFDKEPNFEFNPVKQTKR